MNLKRLIHPGETSGIPDDVRSLKNRKFGSHDIKDLRCQKHNVWEMEKENLELSKMWFGVHRKRSLESLCKESKAK